MVVVIVTTGKCPSGRGESGERGRQKSRSCKEVKCCGTNQKRFLHQPVKL